MTTLEQLDGERWGDLPADATALMRRCHALHRTPLADFSVDDLRLMISQGIGLQRLVPLALDRVEANPLAEGDLYPGDLLVSLFRVAESHWSTDIDAVSRLRQLADAIVAVAQDAALFLERSGS